MASGDHSTHWTDRSFCCRTNRLAIRSNGFLKSCLTNSNHETKILLKNYSKNPSTAPNRLNNPRSLNRANLNCRQNCFHRLMIHLSVSRRHRTSCWTNWTKNQSSTAPSSALKRLTKRLQVQLNNQQTTEV